MKKIIVGLLAFILASAPSALAAQPVALYDYQGHPIGSTFSLGQYYLNVNASLNEVATGASGAAAPALLKVIAGLDGGSLIRPILTDTSGRILTTSVNGSVGATGAAVPSSATFMGVQSGANLVGLTYGQALMAASLPVTISSDQSTLPISAASLPLPSGASTSALQTTGNTSLSSIDGKLTTTVNGLKVDVQTSVLPTGAATSANQTNGTQQTQLVQGGNTATVGVGGALKVDNSAVTQPVSAASLPLPTGAATSALQTQISGQIPATLGAHLTAASMAVNIASDQTVPVTGTFWQATQPVSGTFWQATQPVSGTFWQATQPVSIAASLQTLAPKNANAAFSQTSVTTTASTIAAPANAVKVLIQGDSSNTDCIRYRFDGTAATATVGVVAQAGQDSGQLDSGMSVSVASCSGTQKVNVQYFAQ